MAVGEKPIQKIVLISIDTLRPDYLGCYKSEMNTSPNLDRFASENILFTDVTSQAPSTAISHKSIFYSLYPSVHKTSTNSVPQEKLKSPLEILQSNGFRTAAFVGGGELSRKFGFGKGFDHYGESSTYSNFESKESLQKLEQKVSEWLDQNYQEKFFLFVHSYEVHCPYYPPREYRDEYTAWYKGDLDPKQKCGDNYYNQRALSPDDVQFIRNLYAAQVEYVDDFLGRIFEKLKALNIYDESLIIFLSDHGESLGERDYVGHNFLYNVQLQVPLILRIPGVSSRQIDAPVSLIDLMPTVFRMLRLPSSYPFQGRDMMPLILKGGFFRQDASLISEQSGKVRVRKGNMVAIFSPDHNGNPQVYDLQKDPEEKRNLVREHLDFLRVCKSEYSKMVKKSQSTGTKFLIREAGPPQLNEQEQEQLKALGYID